MSYHTQLRIRILNCTAIKCCQYSLCVPTQSEKLNFAMTRTHDYTLSLTHTQQAVHCDDMSARMLEFSHTAWHQKRLALNYVQPQMVPPVTKVTATLPHTTLYSASHYSVSHCYASHYFLHYFALLNFALLCLTVIFALLCLTLLFTLLYTLLSTVSFMNPTALFCVDKCLIF